MPEHAGAAVSCRILIIGRNSTLFSRLERHLSAAGVAVVAIGHAEIDGFEFRPLDRVFIFSYSRVEAENEKMLDMLLTGGAQHCFYISTATVNCLRRTSCYSYPRCKHKAERVAFEMLGARILRIGVIYDEEAELPAGTTAATKLEDLARLLASPPSSEVTNFFRMVDSPFRSRAERLLQKGYGALMRLCGSYPCLLRPGDLVLKLFGFRWYGYLYLSNRLWLLNPSSEMATTLHSEVDDSDLVGGRHLIF